MIAVGIIACGLLSWHIPCSFMADKFYKPFKRYIREALCSRRKI